MADQIQMPLTRHEAHCVLRVLASHAEKDADEAGMCTWLARRLMRLVDPETRFGDIVQKPNLARCPETIPGAEQGQTFQCERSAGHAGHCRAGKIRFSSGRRERGAVQS